VLYLTVTIEKCVKDLAAAQDTLGLKVSDKEKADLFFYSNAAQLTIYINTNEYEKGFKLIEDNKKLAAIHHEKTHRSYEWAYYYNCARLNFENNELNVALKGLNRILNDSYADKKNIYVVFSRVLFLMVHYQLNNTELALSQARSALRLFGSTSSDDDRFNFERLVTRFIIHMISSKTDEKRSKLLNQFNEDIQQFLSDSPQAKQISQFLNIEKWLKEIS